LQVFLVVVFVSLSDVLVHIFLLLGIRILLLVLDVHHVLLLVAQIVLHLVHGLALEMFQVGFELEIVLHRLVVHPFLVALHLLHALFLIDVGL